MSNATEIAPELDGITKSRLVRALLLKSFLEIIIVCGVISTAAFFYFNPTIRGAITQADAVSVRGWVSNLPMGQTPLELFIDGRFVAAVEITNDRGECPFAFTYQRLGPGTHSVQVYAVNNRFGQSFGLTPITPRSQTFTVAQ